MRQWIFFVLILSIAFSPFLDPPFDEVHITNGNVSSTLQETFLSQNERSPTIDDPIRSVGGTILTADPSVDQSISIDHIPMVIWVTGEEHEDSLVQEPDFVACTDGTTLTFVSQNQSLHLNFTYNGISKIIDNLTSFEVEVPFNESELAVPETPQNLTITLEGSYYFTYDAHINHYQYLTCSDEEGVCVPSCDLYSVEDTTETFERPINASLVYNVESGSALFFLSRPILREQWYRNNQFNVITAAKRIFYRAEVFLDGNSTGSAQLYEFNITTDEYGIAHIVSIPSTLNKTIVFSEFNQSIVLYPLQATNETLSRVYQINSTYTGIGEHVLLLILTDRFLTQFNTSEVIVSRLLTVNKNHTENDEIQENRSIARESMIEEPPLRLSIQSLGLGSIAIIFILIGVKIKKK